jgi:GR25 family glycosyltransferase involved in LPS biosynthesis
MKKMIDKIYCINLDEREDRWLKMEDQFNKIDYNVQRVEAEVGTEDDFNPNNRTMGQLGCLKSHLKVIEDAIENDYENILIFEDDVVICDDFNERLIKMMNYVPENWATIYLGGNCYHEHEKHIPYKETVNKYIKRNNQVYGTWAIIINKKIFENLKHLYKYRIYNADGVHVHIIQKNYESYSILPFMCHITLDVSNITDIVDEFLYRRIKHDFKNKLN